MSAVKALEPGGGVLTSEGWQPVSVENLYRMERVDQPVDPLAMRRTREQQLAALIARMNQGDQTALAELYSAYRHRGAVSPGGRSRGRGADVAGGRLLRRHGRKHPWQRV
jgi:hypothetical protein